MPKMFGAKFPLPVLRRKVIFGTDAITVAAGSTVYLQNAIGEYWGSFNVAESYLFCSFIVTRTGLLKNLVARSHTAPGAGESYTYTVRVNGAPTALTCQIVGAVDIIGTDLVNTAEVVVGDLVTLQLVTSAGASGRIHVTSVEYDTPSTREHYEYFENGATVAIPAGSTRYLPPYGGSPQSDERPQVNHIVPRKGTFKNLVAQAGAAAGAGESFVYTLRVNFVDTALTVTVSGAAQVTGMDTTNIIPVNVGDIVTMKIVTSGAASSQFHKTFMDFEEGDYRAG